MRKENTGRVTYCERIKSIYTRGVEYSIYEEHTQWEDCKEIKFVVIASNYFYIDEGNNVRDAINIIKERYNENIKFNTYSSAVIDSSMVDI